MPKHQSLKQIVCDESRENPQFYLRGQEDNIAAVAAHLKKMGMGSKFEFVGKGCRALVLSPSFSKEIVIRMSTEREEPGYEYHVVGSTERVLRPQMPQVLQAIHTEYVDVKGVNQTYGNTRMRIEILPRLEVPEAGWKAELMGNILKRELNASGYDIADPKEGNIGLLPKSRTPVIIDPSEITYLGKKQLMSGAISNLSGAVGMNYRWSFDEQTAHLKRDWKGYIMDSLSHEQPIISPKTVTYHKGHAQRVVDRELSERDPNSKF